MSYCGCLRIIIKVTDNFCWRSLWVGWIEVHVGCLIQSINRIVECLLTTPSKELSAIRVKEYSYKKNCWAMQAKSPFAQSATPPPPSPPKTDGPPVSNI